MDALESAGGDTGGGGPEMEFRLASSSSDL